MQIMFTQTNIRIPENTKAIKQPTNPSNFPIQVNKLSYFSGERTVLLYGVPGWHSDELTDWRSKQPSSNFPLTQWKTQHSKAAPWRGGMTCVSASPKELCMMAFLRWWSNHGDWGQPLFLTNIWFWMVECILARESTAACKRSEKQFAGKVFTRWMYLGLLSWVGYHHI